MSHSFSIVQQVTVSVPNAPGMLARVSDALRSANVNIEALCCTDRGDNACLHLIVDDTPTAVIVLQTICRVETEQVMAFQKMNKPGAIAQIARFCAGRGVNIHGIYATTCGKRAATVYVMVDDIERARGVT